MSLFPKRESFVRRNSINYRHSLAHFGVLQEKISDDPNINEQFKHFKTTFLEPFRLKFEAAIAEAKSRIRSSKEEQKARLASAKQERIACERDLEAVQERQLCFENQRQKRLNEADNERELIAQLLNQVLDQETLNQRLNSNLLELEELLRQTIKEKELLKQRSTKMMSLVLRELKEYEELLGFKIETLDSGVSFLFLINRDWCRLTLNNIKKLNVVECSPQVPLDSAIMEYEQCGCFFTFLRRVRLEFHMYK